MSVKQNFLDQLAAAETDTVRMETLLALVREIRANDPAGTAKYAQELLELAEKNDNKFFSASANRYLGVIAEQNADYRAAIRYHEESKRLFDELELPSDVIFANNQLGKIYANLGDYSRAIDLFDESLRLSGGAKDPMAEANTLNAFSVIYQRAGNAAKAEEMVKKALAYAEGSSSRRLEGITRVNLGNAYGIKEDWPGAIAEWEKALKIFTEINDEPLIASALGNLGIACERLGDFENAEKYIRQCLELKQKLNDVYDIARSLHNLGTIYRKTGRMEEALGLYTQALGLGEKSQAKSIHVMIYKDLVQLLKQQGDYKRALETFEQSTELEKQLFTEDMNLKTQLLQIRFDVEKMETENEIYRLKNIDLAEANNQITKQKEEIEQKNKDITDSILYAKRIQEAVLPTDSRLKNWFGELFVLYLPKDIVSGDFYWAAEKDGKVLLAVADSTGHGVPGAIMSMMGSSFLSEIIGEQGVTDPAEALSMLRKKVIAAMQQTGGAMENRDGMDIVLCNFDLTKPELVAACANNPVWLIRDGEVDEAEPDKFPVGIFPGDPRPFTNHDTELQAGDAIYLFTDGFADQFGGPKGKKFGYKQLREILLRIHQSPMEEQRAVLEKSFREWKAGNDQVDDVLLIGIRIK